MESIKSINLMRDLKERLKARLSGRVFVESSDADGFPVLIINQDSSPAVTEANLLLRIRPVQDDQQKKNAIGMDQRVYTPHQLDILKQIDGDDKTIESNDGANSAQQLENLMSVMFEASKQAVVIRELKQDSAADAVVAASQLANAVVVKVYRDLWNPLTADV